MSVVKFVCVVAVVLSVFSYSTTQSISGAQIETPCIETGIPSTIQSSGMAYEGGMMVEGGATISPEAWLEEPNDPARNINLTVIVHEKAIVSINGEPTFTMGTLRPYIVRGLENGKKYKFDVEGVFKNETGAEYAAKETITLQAGGSQQVVLHLRRRNRTKPPVVPPPPATPAPAAPAPAAPATAPAN